MKLILRKHRHRWGWGGRLYVGSYFLDFGLFRGGMKQ